MSLSRYDVFHLLSKEAREILSESAEVENYDDIQVKSLHWEQYRKDVLANSLKTINIDTVRAKTAMMSSASMPQLSCRVETNAVDPSSLDLHSTTGKKKELSPLKQCMSSSTLDRINSPGTNNKKQARRLAKLVHGQRNASPKSETLATQYSKILDIDNPYPGLDVSSALMVPRRCSISKVDKNALGKQPEFKEALWKPIHGTPMPFSSFGIAYFYLPSTKKDTGVQSRIRGSTSNIKQNHTGCTKKLLAFRVMGKFPTIKDALALFATQCSHETRPHDFIDYSSMSILQEIELEMNLINVETNLQCKPYKGILSVAKESMADISNMSLQPNQQQLQGGQRFACISLAFDESKRSEQHEDIAISVFTYQCFPTSKSAIRYVKALNPSMLSLLRLRLYIVPLVSWISMEELEHYFAFSKTLDRQLNRRSIK